MEEVINTNEIDTTDKISSPRMVELAVAASGSPIVSPTSNVPTEPKQPKSTQAQQKPNNPRRRLSEPMMDALTEI